MRCIYALFVVVEWANIKTDKIISPKNVTANGDLKYPVVNEYCGRMILKYTDMLNRKDLSAYSVAEVIEYLTRDSGVESFSDYARLHIDRMIKSSLTSFDRGRTVLPLTLSKTA